MVIAVFTLEDILWVHLNSENDINFNHNCITIPDLQLELLILDSIVLQLLEKIIIKTNILHMTTQYIDDKCEISVLIYMPLFMTTYDLYVY